MRKPLSFEEGWARGSARLLVGNASIASAVCRLVREARRHVVVTMFQLHNRTSQFKFRSHFENRKKTNAARIVDCLVRTRKKPIYLVLDRINEAVEADGVEPGSYLERLKRAGHIKFFFDKVLDCRPGNRLLALFHPQMGYLLDRLFRRSGNYRWRRLLRLLDLVSGRSNHKKLVTVDFGSKAVVSSYNWTDHDEVYWNSGVLYDGGAAKRSFLGQLEDSGEFERQFRKDGTSSGRILARGDSLHRLSEASAGMPLLKHLEQPELRACADRFFESAAPGDSVEMAFNMFYDPRLIRIIRKKAESGVFFRILLDEKSQYCDIRVPHLLNYLTWRGLNGVPNVSIRFLRNLLRPFGESHEKAALIRRPRRSPRGVSLAWVGSPNLTTCVLDNGSFRDTVLLIADDNFAEAYRRHFEKLWGSERAFVFSPPPNRLKRSYDYLFNLVSHYLGIVPA